MRFFHDTDINFVGKRTLFFIVSIAIILTGIAGTLIVGVDYGIDFDGGVELPVKFDKAVETSVLRSAIESTGVNGEIKSFGKDNQFLIRYDTSSQSHELVQKVINEEFSELNPDILGVTKIGPKIGKELRSQAFIAILLSVIGILLYIAFRFEFVFGLGAIVALIHDVFITFFALIFFHNAGILDLEIDSSIFAAMLTVVGFSINDTVIIFDRIRENKEKMKGQPFIKMVNKSINETMSRTVNTVLTVILVLATLVAFGGPVLKGFSFTMLAGIITGTYSSIFIASSFVIWYLEKVKKVPVASPQGTASVKKKAKV